MIHTVTHYYQDKKGNKMSLTPITSQTKYIVTLYNSSGCQLNSEYSANPWHPQEWIVEEGDTIEVFDRENEYWFPNYSI